jgi:hypothetical protein
VSEQRQRICRGLLALYIPKNQGKNTCETPTVPSAVRYGPQGVRRLGTGTNRGGAFRSSRRGVLAGSGENVVHAEKSKKGKKTRVCTKRGESLETSFHLRVPLRFVYLVIFQIKISMYVYESRGPDLPLPRLRVTARPTPSKKSKPPPSSTLHLPTSTALLMY